MVDREALSGKLGPRQGVITWLWFPMTTQHRTVQQVATVYQSQDASLEMKNEKLASNKWKSLHL